MGFLKADSGQISSMERTITGFKEADFAEVRAR